MDEGLTLKVVVLTGDWINYDVRVMDGVEEGCSELILLANQVASSSRAKCDWRVFERGVSQTQSTKR